MTREEALNRYDRIRYNLLNSDDKAAVDVAFEALRERESAKNAHCNSCKKRNGWIPVTERLPEKHTIVLCYKDKQWRLGYYIGAAYSKGVAAFRHPKDQFAFGVTHWMPLPSTEGLNDT